jgi:hypothetical protein
MRTILLLICISLISGCVSLGVAGRFSANSGEAVVIERGGSVRFEANGKKEFIGVIADQRGLLSFVSLRKPITVDLRDPDPSPSVKPSISFSADRKSIVVDWRGFGREQRPSEFRRDEKG